MEKQKKSAMIRFPVILLAVSAILLCASPCSALVVEGPVTIPSDEYPYPINENVFVEYDGLLNLLDGGLINGYVNVYEGCKLNLQGGCIDSDLYAANYSEVNITGGSVNGLIIVDPFATVTVFGTDFAVVNGQIDSSGTYFTPTPFTYCLLTVTYGGVDDPIDLTFFVFTTDPDVHIYLAAPSIEVQIDIKPGSDQNNINLKSKGVVPVAVLTTADFDAYMVDLASVTFAGAAPVRWKLEDVDDDGDDDLLLHFRTQELELDQGSTEATLTAELAQMTAESTEQVNDGTIVSGTDEVRIISSKK